MINRICVGRSFVNVFNNKRIFWRIWSHEKYKPMYSSTEKQKQRSGH